MDKPFEESEKVLLVKVGVETGIAKRYLGEQNC